MGRLKQLHATLNGGPFDGYPVDLARHPQGVSSLRIMLHGKDGKTDWDGHYRNSFWIDTKDAPTSAVSLSSRDRAVALGYRVEDGI